MVARLNMSIHLCMWGSSSSSIVGSKSKYRFYLRITSKSRDPSRCVNENFVIYKWLLLESLFPIKRKSKKDKNKILREEKKTKSLCLLWKFYSYLLHHEWALICKWSSLINLFRKAWISRRMAAQQRQKEHFNA